MTLGEKIARQRKNQNLTQEQLANLLGVSRQSISKWESDITYPETDKLVKMGQLFSCSMDYLLKETVTDTETAQKSTASASAFSSLYSNVKKRCKERKSEKTVFGMPLYHIGWNAKGFIAIGINAKGVISVGLFSRGAVSVGLLSFGLLSFGLLSVGLAAFAASFALGLLSVGAIAVGLFAIGAICIGIVSCGALSVGCLSVGALAVGHYAAVGDYARALYAVGNTEAYGSVYVHLGKLTQTELAYMKVWLDANVPNYLSWAKEIFLYFIR